MKTVFRYIRPYLGIMLLATTLKGLAAFAELAIPEILAVIIDDAVPTGEMALVVRWGAVMLGFAALTFAFNVFGNRTAAVAAAKFSRDLRHGLFDKTVRLDLADTDRIGLSSLISRITSDTYNITSFLARFMRIGIKAPLMLIGGIVMTLLIEWRLALVLIAVLPFVSLVVAIITKKSIPIYLKEQDVLDSMVRKVDETAAGIRVVKALSKEDDEKANFRAVSAALSKEEIRAGRLMSANKPLTDLILNLGLCGVIALGAFLAREEGFDAAGKLLAFMTYFTLILNHMIVMTRIFIQASRAVASADRVEEVLLAESKLDLQKFDRENDGNAICFDHVTFSYNKMRPDLDDVTFTLGEGETLGIIGATGAGKSTVVSLLLRLYDPDGGRILLHGEDLRSIPRETLHKKFGVAFQNDFIPSGSIRSNVAFFRDATDEEIGKALDTAQATFAFGGGNDGLDREITTRGSNISGGQRQRLILARAMLGKPDILILDDSSSALDYKTDAALRRAIRRDMHTTTVIIAQRISSIRHADKILVLSEGKIIGQGTHEELMLSVPAYREIAEVQMGGVTA